MTSFSMSMCLGDLAHPIVLQSLSPPRSLEDLVLCTSEGEYHAIPAKAREAPAEEDEEEVSRVDLSRIILQVDFEEELLSFNC